MRTPARAVAWLCCLFAWAALAGPAEVPVHVVGPPAPRMAALDDAMSAFLRTNGVPRAQLAVVRRGRLVFDHAYTLGEEGADATTPTNLFRIASVTKPVTAVAVMRLVEEGRLGLDQPVAPLLDATDAADTRWAAITVRHLLQHRGGWDSKASGDPMFQDREIAAASGSPLPVTIPSIIAHMKRRPLDFAPGSREAYSNFGYLLLGRVVEKAGGMPYGRFVREHVFRRAGAGPVHVGRVASADRWPGEVDCSQPDLPLARSVLGDGMAPWCHGGFNLANMDAHGGLVCSASSLARVAAALDQRQDGALLRAGTVVRMWARPPEVASDAAAFYASGWLVRPVDGGRVNAWHNGSLPGTRSLLVRLGTGTCWAVLLNRREKEGQPDFALALDVGVNRLLARLPADAWPAE